MPSSDKKIRLATPEPAASHNHYIAIAVQPGIEWVGSLDFSTNRDYRELVDGVLVSGEWALPDRLAVIKCSQQGIPTFHFMDGILEWRNLFENPRSNDASRGSPLYQPILSDFTFCLGQLQKLQLEWLGNSNAVASGLPRLGCEKIATSRRQNHPSTRSVLIATANTPWFTDEQKLEFCREFIPFYECCRDQSEFSIKWRLAPSLWNELGEKNPEASSNLLDDLQSVDCVVCTPSTLVLEAMQFGVPTMVFDPYNRPDFLPSAWRATNGDTAFKMIPALLEADPQRCRLQNVLRDYQISNSAATIPKILSVIQSATATNAANCDAFLCESKDNQSNAEEGFKVSLEARHSALLSTISTLEAKLHEKSQIATALYKQVHMPTLLQGFRQFLRAFRGQIRR